MQKNSSASCIAEDAWQLSSAYDAKNSSASCVAEDAWQLSSAYDAKTFFVSCVVEDAWQLSSAYDAKNSSASCVAELEMVHEEVLYLRRSVRRAWRSDVEAPRSCTLNLLAPPTKARRAMRK